MRLIKHLKHSFRNTPIYQSGRPLITLLFAGLVGLLFIEPAIANKFQTIGGGVSGGSEKKLAVLKEIALYAGSFLIFLGAMALLTRNRFEGTIGMRSKGDNLGPVIIVPIILMIFGSTLIFFHFL